MFGRLKKLCYFCGVKEQTDMNENNIKKVENILPYLLHI